MVRVERRRTQTLHTLQGPCATRSHRSQLHAPAQTLNRSLFPSPYPTALLSLCRVPHIVDESFPLSSLSHCTDGWSALPPVEGGVASHLSPFSSRMSCGNSVRPLTLETSSSSSTDTSRFLSTSTSSPRMWFSPTPCMLANRLGDAFTSTGDRGLETRDQRSIHTARLCPKQKWRRRSNVWSRPSTHGGFNTVRSFVLRP